MEIILFLIAAICVIMLIYNVVVAIFKLSSMQNRIIRSIKPSIKQYRNPAHLDNLLASKNSYYRNMPDVYKEEFRNRCLRASEHFRWIEGNGQTITEEMRLLVSASAVQLLFGQPKVDLGHYNTIVLYSDAYLNDHTHFYHKGEVNNRFIVLSYKHFEEGYAIEDDKINLGLHEMTHALDLGVFLSHSKRYFQRRLLDNFIKKTYDEFQSMQRGENDFLRGYGAQNFREFFAVAVEHFFEAPREFIEKMPHLYRELCLVLNQDPAAGICRGISPERFPSHNNQTAYKWNSSTTPRFIIKTSSIGVMKKTITLSIILLVLLVIANQSNTDDWVIFIPAILITGTLLWLNIFRGHHYLAITQSHLVILSLTKQQVQSFHLQNIVLVAFERQLSHLKMQVCWHNGEEIAETEIKTSLSETDLIELKKQFINLDITVVTDGKFG